MKLTLSILILAVAATIAQAQSIFVTNGTHLVVSNSVADVKAYTPFQMLSMERNVTNQLYQLAVARQQAEQEYVQITMYLRMMAQWGLTNPPPVMTNAIATNHASTNAVSAPSTNKPSARLQIQGVPIGDGGTMAVQFRPRQTPHIL